MAYSKAKLKSNGDRASPCFKPVLTGIMSDKFLPTRALLYISVRHICKVYKELMYCFVVFPFSSSIWRMQNIWSVVDLLRRNPPWWSPVISSAYVVNIDSRMLGKILYVFGKSDTPLQLPQSLLSPFLKIDTCTMIDSFHSLFQIEIICLWIS